MNTNPYQRAFPNANGAPQGVPPPHGRGPSPAPPSALHQASPSPSPGPSFSPGPSSASRPISPASDQNPGAARRAKRHYPTYAVADPSITSQIPPATPVGYSSQPHTFTPAAAATAPLPAQPNNVPLAGYPPSSGYPAQTGYASPTFSSPAPGYNGITNGMANLDVNKSLPPLREDVSLMGQSPAIADLGDTSRFPDIPSNASVTHSPHAQCPRELNHCTLNAIPYSNSLLKKSKLPLALILEPNPSAPKADIPVVNDSVIARCTRCKTYINPFVRFSGDGRNWQCNMCSLDNEVPPGFDYDTISQQPIDRWSRAELNYGCVDFVATVDYMIRPPQPPTFVFVLDISFLMAQTGTLGVVTEAILQSLDSLPNEEGRTKIAFITADNAVGFYKLTGDGPEMLVVGDVSDVYLPRAASDLLVTLTEAKTMIRDLLTRMKTMYNETHAPSNCLGAALNAACQLLSSTGGKIVCFQGSLPSVGEGAIKPTEDKKGILDTALMSPSSSFYKTFATECAKAQVCADMFVFGSGGLSDVATLNVIPRFTGGQTYYYPHFQATNPAVCEKLKAEIQALLSQKIGLEAVMRTRCSPGIICKAFYGNCTTRVPDIMALPNVPCDQSYCVELGFEEDIPGRFAYFQTALLYTTSFGERRIRVMNLCLPVTKVLAEVFAGADQVAVARTLCHQAIDKAATQKLRDGREWLAKETADICGAYSKEVLGTGATGAPRLTMCKNLGLMPVLILGVLKSETFNDTSVIPPDIRSQTTVLLRILPMASWVKFVYPNFYALHNIPPHVGVPDKTTGLVTMPTRLNLSSEKLERHGCYLLEDGQRICIWIGKEAVPPLCMDLLNVPNISQVQSGEVPELPLLNNPLSKRVAAIVSQIRNHRQGTIYPSISIVKEDGDPMLRAAFLSKLIEDRAPHGPTTAGSNQQQVNSGMSYFQWLGFVRAKCQ